MLVGYFDASGSVDQRAFAVAGYVASVEAWLAWCGCWTERLAQDGLAYFHTTDFNASRAEFSGWKGDERRRRQLIIDLTGIIRDAGLTRKFGTVIDTSHIAQEFSEVEQRHWKLTPFLLMARTCMGQIRQWAIREGIQKWPALVFEDGDTGRGDLQERFRLDQIPSPQFAPKRDRVGTDGLLVEGAIPLQAADLLAYELFDPTRKIAQDGYIKRIKKTFDALDDGTPGDLGLTKPEHLKVMRVSLERDEPLP